MYPAQYLTYGVEGTANLTVLPTHQKQYVITDHLGSARVILDSSGMVVDRIDYDPFGTPMAVSGAVTGVRKSFIDKERDAESGLMNLGVRQLDGPRFTSGDPKWEKYPMLSPYTYSTNNPLTISDPNGAEFNFVKLEKNEKDELVRVPDPGAKALFENVLRKMEEAGIVRSQELRYLYESKDFVIDFVLVENSFRSGFSDENKDNGSRPTLEWAAYSALEYLAPNDKGDIVSQYTSPAMALVHEGNHGYNYFKNPAQYVFDRKLDPNNVYTNKVEEDACHAEFEAGRVLNQVQYIRPNYTKSNIVRVFDVIGPMSNVPLN